MIQTIEGDIITLAKENKFDILIHGCNCFNTMGAGVALQIKQEFPAMYAADQRTEKGDHNKLGTYSLAYIEGTHQLTNNSDLYEFIGINAYTQYKYGKGGPHFDYNAFEKILQNIQKKYPNRTIGMPKIGAGLAGGDWNKIEKIIKNVFDNSSNSEESQNYGNNIIIVEYKDK